MRLFSFIGLILSSISAAQGIDPKSDSVLIAAHRGGYVDDKADNAPENTVANVAVAISKGYDVFETDIQQTSDGVFVIVHDPTLERETNGSGPVSALTLAELKKLRKRYKDGSLSDQTVATFEELIAAGKGKLLFKPDLKPDVVEHFDELARLIVKMEMTDQVFLRTTPKDADTIETCFKNGTPRVEVMFRVKTAEQVNDLSKRFAPKTIEIKLEKEDKLTDEKQRAIQRARELGILVETHVYKDLEQAEELIQLGVRMFHTTDPDGIATFLKSRK